MAAQSPRRARRSQGELESHHWSYADLEYLTGKAANTLYQHCRRGSFDPASLESIIYFVARHGTPEVKRNILEYTLQPSAKNPAN
jgi:hypothetical protein